MMEEREPFGGVEEGGRNGDDFPCCLTGGEGEFAIVVEAFEHREDGDMDFGR